MTGSAQLDPQDLRRLLLQASVSGTAGQEALTRLYQHYDPLVRAALPKHLGPEDAEDLAMDVWAGVVSELRQGRGLRSHQDIVALIGETIRQAGAARPEAAPQLVVKRPRTLWDAVKRFLSQLAPAKEMDDQR